jgi:hypothetical protein
MRAITLFFLLTAFVSCYFNKYEKTIKGCYALESREYFFSNDSSIIEGFIFDKQLNSPLADKWVFIKETKMSTRSNSNGYFIFKLSAGSYSFNIMAAGFSDMQTKNIKVEKNEKIKLKFRMGTHVIYER